MILIRTFNQNLFGLFADGCGDISWRAVSLALLFAHRRKTIWIKLTSSLELVFDCHEHINCQL